MSVRHNIRITDPEEELAHFYKVLSSVYDKHVPNRTKRVKRNFFFNLSLSPCLTSYSQKAMKRRDKIKKEKDYPEFKETKKTCEVFSKAGKKGFFVDKIVSSQTNNTSLIWNSFNALAKTSSSKLTILNAFTA